jgi:hypothetical protein
MFENERSALLNVAVDAHLPVRLSQHDLILSSVRVVAIRAFHQTFRHAMMRGQCKLAFNNFVARIAKLRLRPAKETAVQPPCFVHWPGRYKHRGLRANSLHTASIVLEAGEMRGMARLAVQTPQLVLGTVECGLIVAGHMTGKATFRILGGRAAKRKYELHRCKDCGVIALRISHSFDMRPRRAVTGLTSGSVSVRPLLNSRMRSLLKLS